MAKIKLIPVLVVAALYWILGGIWYSPLLFAKPWVKAMGLDINDKAKMDAIRKSAGSAYFQVFVVSLITALIFQRLFYFVHTPSALYGVHTAVIICFGTVVASKYTQKLFGQGNWTLFFIDCGYQLVSFVAMGAILGGWKV